MQNNIGVLERIEGYITTAKGLVAQLEAIHASLSGIAADLETHIQHGNVEKQTVTTNAQSIITAVQQEATAKIDGLEKGQNIIGGMLDYFHGTSLTNQEAEPAPADQEKAA